MVKPSEKSDSKSNSGAHKRKLPNGVSEKSLNETRQYEKDIIAQQSTVFNDNPPWPIGHQPKPQINHVHLIGCVTKDRKVWIISIRITELQCLNQKPPMLCYVSAQLYFLIRRSSKAKKFKDSTQFCSCTNERKKNMRNDKMNYLCIFEKQLFLFSSWYNQAKCF
jgi:hypothetical protein